jgi:hypothetical protein
MLIGTTAMMLGGAAAVLGAILQGSDLLARQAPGLLLGGASVALVLVRRVSRP